MNQFIEQHINILEEKLRIDNCSAEIEIKVPKGSLLFQGHFSEISVLPGAFELLIIKHWCEKLLGTSLIIHHIKKSRFNAPILAEEHFIVKLKIHFNEEKLLYWVKGQIEKHQAIIMSTTMELKVYS